MTDHSGEMRGNAVTACENRDGPGRCANTTPDLTEAPPVSQTGRTARLMGTISPLRAPQVTQARSSASGAA